MKLRFGVFLIVAAAAMALSCATATLRAQDPSAQTPAAPPAAATTAAATTAAATTAATTWSGIYTPDQAAKGEAIYNDKCTRCHGPDGAGADAPTLAGGEFASNWDSLDVGQLFDRTRNTMPQDDPQTLSREDTSALLAFIFVKNSFPAGETPLTTDRDALGKIKYLANKP